MSDKTTLKKAADPFVRLVRMNEPLSISDDRPLSDVLPGEWPTWGDLKRLVEALQRGR